MHVRGGEFDVAERWCLEGDRVRFLAANEDSTGILVGALHFRSQADVVELIVREVRWPVALLAVGFEEVELHPAHRRLRHAVPVIAGLIAVIGSISRQERPFVSRDGFDQPVTGRIGVKDAAKLRAIAVDPVQYRDRLLERHVHFAGSLQRPQHLLFQRLRAAVPHLRLLKSDVDEDRRVTAHALFIDSFRERLRATEAAPRIMARRTRDSPIGGEPRVEEELLAERDFLGSRRVVLRVSHLGQPERIVSERGIDQAAQHERQQKRTRDEASHARRVV